MTSDVDSPSGTPRHPALRVELLEMHRVDQEARGFSGSGDAPGPADSERMREVDAQHTARLARIVNELGWPGRSLVRDDGAHAAWLIAQHADHDLAFQRRALALIETERARGEMRANHVAYLHDRVAANEGRPQRYGTQGRCSAPSRWEPLPLEEPDRVDALRAAVGLGPLEEYRRLVSGYCP